MGPLRRQVPWLSRRDRSSADSLRLTFHGGGVRREVLLGLTILVRAAASKINRTQAAKLDLVGAALSVIGMSLTVFGVFEVGEWGW